MVSETNIDGIVTSAFESYLRSLFDRKGRRRRRFEQMLPGVSNFVSDIDFVPESDPTKAKLTIARITERVKAAVPCVMIGETTIGLRKTGFGRSLAQSRVSRKVIANHIGIFREVGVNFLVVANSRSDCHALSQALHVILFDAANFLTGSVLLPEDPDATWMIRIPQTIDPGTPSKETMGEDNQMQIWSNTVLVTCFFEDSFIASGSDIDDPVVNTQSEEVVIDFPTTGRVGRRVEGSITGLPFQAVVSLDNINVASLQKTESGNYAITFRRPGTVRVRVFDGSANGLQDQGSSIQPNIVAVHEIAVTF
jgi:hypothetical protein